MGPCDASHFVFLDFSSLRRSIMKEWMKGSAVALLVAAFLGAAVVLSANEGSSSAEDGRRQPVTEKGTEHLLTKASASSYGLLDVHCWARLDAQGALIDGYNVVSSRRLLTGGYEVVFNTSVEHAAYQATVATTTVGIPPRGSAMVAPRSGNRFAVWIDTTDEHGNYADRPVHIVTVKRAFSD
jgi:hypothetical protein